MSNSYHLAQINVGRLHAPTDDPMIADFMAGLDRINALAEASPGFVWRFQTAEGNATSVRPFDEDLMLLNFSVWLDLESLRAFTYRGDHVGFLRRRREWFAPIRDHVLALWWIPAGHLPSIEESINRLHLLRQRGPTADAFTFRDSFAAPIVETTLPLPLDS